MAVIFCWFTCSLLSVSVLYALNAAYKASLFAPSAVLNASNADCCAVIDAINNCCRFLFAFIDSVNAVLMLVKALLMAFIFCWLVSIFRAFLTRFLVFLVIFLLFCATSDWTRFAFSDSHMFEITKYRLFLQTVLGVFPEEKLPVQS